MGHISNLDMGSGNDKSGTGVSEQDIYLFYEDLVSITSCLFTCP